MIMREKEEWIKTTMESIERINRAQLPEDLVEKITINAYTNQVRIISIRPISKWMAAASIVLLVCLNIFVIIQYNKSNIIAQNETNPFHDEYFAYLDYLK
jgi:hypothetical protein